MIEQDTIKLLRECDAGAKMGISSIEDVLGHVRESELERRFFSRLVELGIAVDIECNRR